MSTLRFRYSVMVKDLLFRGVIMSSNYNRLPRPAVVMVREGTSRVVVKAETYEDLIRNDL